MNSLNKDITPFFFIIMNIVKLDFEEDDSNRTFEKVKKVHHDVIKKHIPRTIREGENGLE